MTEAEWHASTDACAMMSFLMGGATGKLASDNLKKRGITDRKLRLLCAESFFAAHGQRLSDHSPWRQWEQGEESDLERAWAQTPLGDAWASCLNYRDDNRRNVPGLLREIVGNPFVVVERVHERCASRSENPGPGRRLLRFHDSWRTPTVRDLAATIWHERRWDLMPFLSDALEEAGCTDESILGHLRGRQWCPVCAGRAGEYIPRCEPSQGTDWYECPSCKGTGMLRSGPHVRGCWVLELCLDAR